VENRTALEDTIAFQGTREWPRRGATRQATRIDPPGAQPGVRRQPSAHAFVSRVGVTLGACRLGHVCVAGWTRKHLRMGGTIRQVQAPARRNVVSPTGAYGHPSDCQEQEAGGEKSEIPSELLLARMYVVNTQNLVVDDSLQEVEEPPSDGKGAPQRSG
jgi:hypothetical protein